MPLPISDNNFAHNLNQIVSELLTGHMILVSDASDREGEADFIAAAATITLENMAKIIRYSSGIICAPMLPARAKELDLPAMVPPQKNNAPYATAFTISVDAKKNMTTGISAKERLLTLRLLADAKTQPDDLVKPGHMFPLIADAGGVLKRAGHTEAAVELVRMAGFCPAVAVIAELMNDDGSVKKGQEVLDFAKQHNLRHITIAELRQYIQEQR